LLHVGHPAPLDVVHWVRRDESEPHPALKDEPKRQQSCPERPVGEGFADAPHGATRRPLGLDKVLDKQRRRRAYARLRAHPGQPSQSSCRRSCDGRR
jgi:hypothetical protein